MQGHVTWADFLQQIRADIKDSQQNDVFTAVDVPIIAHVDQLLKLIPEREEHLEVICRSREGNEKRKVAQALARKKAEEIVRRDEES